MALSWSQDRPEHHGIGKARGSGAGTADRYGIVPVLFCENIFSFIAVLLDFGHE
jgi:hypothetical protein